MKVICITDIHPDRGDKVKQLKIGEYYTASQCQVYPRNYDIAEVPTFQGLPVSYRKEFFAPLSSIDETEFERNYNLVTLPSNY